MSEPSKRQWRARAKTLEPVPTTLQRRIAGHVAAFLADIADRDGLDGPVLGYVALPDEIAVDEVPAVDALPRLDDDGVMSIHADDGRRQRHRLGMEQPTAGLAVIDPATLSAVLVPGRFFDRDGFRLGRGGGHYDRLVPSLTPGVPVVGVTCEARIVDRLPREPHDRPMTHLATEQGVFSTPFSPAPEQNGVENGEARELDP